MFELLTKFKKKYINQLNSNPYTNIKNILSALLHITFLPAICYVKKKCFYFLKYLSEQLI